MKQQNNYAFIDGQNLYLSIRDLGWKLDYKKFRVYLREKYGVQKAFLFLGYLPRNIKLYQFLRECGFTLIFKCVDYEQTEVKGNVDGELILHAMIEYQNYDQAIIVSGDGDFYCLIEYLQRQNKLLHLFIPNRNKYSHFLKVFGQNKLVFFDRFKNALEHKN